MLKIRFKYFCLLLTFLVLNVYALKGNDVIKSSRTNSEVVLAPIFQSHMVLQCDQEINIWGTAKPENQFNVTFDGKIIKALANKFGEWKVSFPAHKASFTPLELEVDGLIINDILIGELWICSGQSNMVRQLSENDGAAEELATTDKNSIRLIKYYHPNLVAKNGYSEAELKRSNTKDFFKGVWTLNEKDEALKFSAVGWVFGEKLFKELKVPIGIIELAVGGSAINNWISPESLKSNPEFATLFTKDWLSNENVDNGHRVRAKGALKGFLPMNGHPYIVGETKYRWMCEPGFLFEAGIKPLKNLNFKGVVWYQGETDAITLNSLEQHKKLFPLLVKDWRAFFGDRNFPFIYIQLPSFNKDTWPAFRELQRNALKEIPNSYMAITFDTGQADNVHPTDKIPIGNRVSFLALNNVYQIKNKKPSFPQIEKVKNKKDEIIIQLNQKMAESVPNDIKGFEVEDENGKFLTVKAMRQGEDKIVLEKTGGVKSIRYGWIPFAKPIVEIFNKSGLPLGPVHVNLNQSL